MKTMLQNIDGDQSKLLNRISTIIFVLSMLLFAPFFLLNANAQTQSIEMGGAGSEPSPNLGPETSVTIPLVHDINNPDPGTFSPYFPNITATISFDNFQYFVSQNTNDDELDSDNPPVVVGWRFNPDGDLVDGMSDGDDELMVVPFTVLDESIDCYDPVGLDDNCFNLYEISGMEGFYSSTEPTPGEGIDFLDNRGAFIAASFEGITDPYESAARVHIADMTITFNRPINNPVLHFFGLGGLWDYQTGDDPPNFYINAGTVEFDFLPAESSPINGLSVLSSNTDENNGKGLAISGNSIISNWNVPDVIDTFDSEEDDNGVANGSIIVEGDEIETITLRMYARAINDITAAREAFGEDGNGFCAVEDGCYLGDSAFGWNGGATGEGGDVIDSYNIAHDLFVLSISMEVEPDEVELTEGESYRMLSSPVANTTYRELLGNLWVQGPDVQGADLIGGDPNIFTWPLGDAGDESNWNSTLDLGEDIPEGEGFLFTVFEDDEYEVSGTFPKTLSVIGSEPQLPITIESSSGDTDGWMLLGNPMKDPLSISTLLTDATDTESVVYVWDRGTDSAPDKGWRYSGTLPGGVDVLGTIDEGVLMPFQGFFIQKSSNDAEVEFNDGQRSIGTEGTFYRKELPLNAISFSVTGEELGNTLWLTFTENGSVERLKNDALELASYNEHFINFATKKSDGVLLTLAHMPIPGDEFEIPVTIQSTRSGNYTITATDFNLSLSHDLYFIDTEKNESIRIDQNFKYSFTLNQAAKANPSSPTAALAKGPQKATTEFADRFLITTQPRDIESTLPDAIALQQNYPNPFNPTTQIRYELPQQSDVRLQVYDMIGRQVATLVNENVQAGVHNVNFDASSLSSGVYIYRLQAGNTTLTRKLTVVK